MTNGHSRAIFCYMEPFTVLEALILHNTVLMYLIVSVINTVYSKDDGP